VFWRRPVCDDGAIYEQFPLNCQLIGVLHFVAFVDAGNRFTMLSPGTSLFLDKLVWGAFFCRDAGILCEEPVHDGPAALASLSHVVAVKKLLG